MDLNKVMLIWRITSDLDVKKIPDSGNSVVNFNVATNRKYTNREGNIIEEAEFHKCVAFGKSADILWQYLEKGKKIFIEWRLRTRKWEDTSWNTRYTTEIVVENFIFLDNKWVTSSNQNNILEENNSSEQEEDLPF